MTETVVRILPLPGGPVPLHGLYLDPLLAPPPERSKSFVYANFITSLDGRISLPDPRTLKRAVPRAIANPRDFRLFQELAACADAVVMSGRYVRDLPNAVAARSFPVSGKREYADLLRWRGEHGLPPQPAIIILSASLDLPPLAPLIASGRSVYLATGSAAEPQRVATFESDGVRVLTVGDGREVGGRRLVEALAREGHHNIYVIGGGRILNAFIVDHALDRLYLTLACRLLGGASFDTLLTGPPLEPAASFTLRALHYDAKGSAASTVEQLFAILDRSTKELRASQEPLDADRKTSASS
jgi:riboflavin biosynthesis pyrimidine reductase